MNSLYSKIAYRKSYKGILPRILLYIVLIMQLGMVIFPIYIMFLTSFKNNKEIFTNPIGLPEHFSFQNIYDLMVKHNYLVYFRNSLFVLIATLILILLISVFAAYALAKYKFKLNRIIYFYFIAGLMLPTKLGTINLFQIIQKLGLFDNLFGLIILYTAMEISLGVFVLTDFIKLIPDELSQAARIDGCSEFGILFKIIMPLIRPALVTVAIFVGMPIWNDFWFPLIFIRSDNLKTVPLATTYFFGQYLSNWGLVFSALSLASLPVIIIYLVLSRQFIKGLTSGAIKG